MHGKTNVLLQDALELAGLLRPTWDAKSAEIARSGVPTMLKTSDRKLSEKLDRVESDLAELRDKRNEANAELESAQETYSESDDLSSDSDEFKAVKQARAKVGEIDDKIQDRTNVQVELLKQLKRDPDHALSEDERKRPRAVEGIGWDVEALLADDTVRKVLRDHANSSDAVKLGRLVLGEVVSRDAFVADITASTNMRRGEFGGIVPQLRRQLSLLDLLPTGSMDANTFPYTQEGGSFSGAAETDEGAAKPEGAITFTDAEAIARTIAAWFKVQKQSLEDFSALQAVIENRLRYMVLRRLEAQVLAGNGTAPNLRGILNTSGIGSVAYDGGVELADLILDGIVNTMLADGQATGIVMNPLDWAKVVKAKSSGDGQYFSGGPFQVTPQVMWGTPLIPSAAITQGTALVGDWELGAMLLIRSGVQVLMSDSDQDDFTKNKVTILGEMRGALPVFRPAVFTTVDLDPA